MEKVNLELNTQELGIITESLEVLQQNCERANRTIVHDKIDLGPIHDLQNKLQVKDDDELRFIDKTIVLSNQAIVELAYLTMETIKAVYGKKLFFEVANCYLACFYRVRSMLKEVDREYLAGHKGIVEFYQEGRELSNDNDRLYFDGRTKDDCNQCADKPMCAAGQAFCRWPFNRRITNNTYTEPDDSIPGIKDDVIL